MLVPLLPQTEWVETRGSIHCKHALEMVNFVLNQLGHTTFEIGGLRLTSQVLISDRNSISPVNSDHQARKRETVIPDREVLVSHVHDLRIHQNPGFGCFHVNDAQGSADLRCGNRPSNALPRCGVSERFLEVVQDDADSRRTRMFNRRGSGPKDRIS